MKYSSAVVYCIVVLALLLLAEHQVEARRRGRISGLVRRIVPRKVKQIASTVVRRAVSKVPLAKAVPRRRRGSIFKRIKSAARRVGSGIARAAKKVGGSKFGRIVGKIGKIGINKVQ